MPFVISHSINLLVSYVAFVGLLPAFIFHKTVSIFCILFVRVWVCLVIVSTLVLDIFWRQFSLFFCSFVPLCHKPCCPRYPCGISQSSVLSTNIQSVCFKKFLLFRQIQWKVVRKALCWVEFIEENSCVKSISSN